MNIEVLKTLQIVAERGSLTAAARELGLSQPAVSMQIASLEEYFGSRLLMRNTRGVELTDAGREVLLLGNDLEVRISKTKASILQNALGIRGELRISASNIPGMFILPQLLNRFQQVYPAVKVELKIDNSRSAVDSLLSGAVDLAALGEPISNDRLNIKMIKEDRIIFIAPIHFDFKGQASFAGLIAEQVPLLRRTEGSATANLVIQHFKEAQLNIEDLNVVGSYSSVIPQIQAVRNGGGCAFVSELAAADALALRQVQKIAMIGLPLERKLSMAIVSTGETSKAAMAFWNMIIEGDR